MNQKVTAAALADMVTAGMTDRQIAAETGCRRASIADRRRKMGLRCNRESVSASARSRQAAGGRRNVAVMLDSLRSKAAELGSAYGLRDLRPTAVAIVLKLLDGPATVRSLLSSLSQFHSGFDSHRGSATSEGRRIYFLALLKNLIACGMVIRVRPPVGDGRLFLYMLTVKTLEVLGADQGSDDATSEDRVGGGGQILPQADPGVRGGPDGP